MRLTQVQRAGKQPMSAEEFLRGTPVKAGTQVDLMPRYKLTIEYDGAPFAGWQIQADELTVQGVLTAAIEALRGEKTLVQGAGRTDAGVHARGQVAHVDLAKDWDADTVRDALNAHLRPHPVAVLSAERVAGDFNARISAVKRHYLYRIVNRRADLALEPAAPGACRARSMPRRCTPPRSGWSASTTSRRSAPPNARPNRR